VLYTLFCLGPVLGLVDIYYFRYSLVADHYQYVAMPGLIVLVVAAAARFAHRHTIDRVTLRVASLGLVAVLGGLTWQQVDIYQTPQQLWRDTLARNPGCWLAHNQLANLVNSSQKVDDARQHYLEALRLIEHQFGAGHVETARVHNNLGMLLGQSARVDSDPAMMLQAITHLETACRIDPDRSEYIESLAGVLKEQGQIERAIVRLRDFVARHPDAAGTWIVLADCLVAVGRGAEADEARRRSRQADPRRQHP